MRRIGFTDRSLDTAIWLPHYLPAWSSRADTAASYHLDGATLTLDIPTDHPLWCPGLHDPPIRISGIQSGNWSGPAGSPRGQQRFRDGLTVQEEQQPFAGWLPASGRVAIRARMELTPRTMAALWLNGMEDDPDQQRSGELCIFEIFGRALHDDPPSAEVGVGIKPYTDPALAAGFAAPRLSIDVSEFHTYAVDWDAESAVFTVDGSEVRRCANSPTYPMQLMLAVFDFPTWPGDDTVPRLIVDELTGSP